MDGMIFVVLPCRCFLTIQGETFSLVSGYSNHNIFRTISFLEALNISLFVIIKKLYDEMNY